MKILFVWTGVTSYMADCWRALAAEPGVELKVIVEQVASGREFKADRVLAGLDYRLVVQHPNANTIEQSNNRTIEQTNGWLPDILFAVGWHSKVVRAFVTRADWRNVPKVCCYDLPWDGSFRRIAARWVLGGFLRHYAAAYVPGVACERYAKWLRFPKIYKGLFSIDAEKFGGKATVGGTKPGRRDFLYVGRFAPEKRLDVLIRAFARYRQLGGTWRLDLYGAGELPDLSEQSGLLTPAVRAALGVHGFIQPDAVPGVYAAHGCFVLASDFDPWPLVVLQACANGMPVVVSDRCTNHYELVRENGILFPHGDVEAMAAAMLRVECEGLVGEAGRQLAEPYDKAEWTRRTLGICRELVKK